MDEKETLFCFALGKDTPVIANGKLIVAKDLEEGTQLNSTGGVVIALSTELFDRVADVKVGRCHFITSPKTKIKVYFRSFMENSSKEITLLTVCPQMDCYKNEKKSGYFQLTEESDKKYLERVKINTLCIHELDNFHLITLKKNQIKNKSEVLRQIQNESPKVVPNLIEPKTEYILTIESVIQNTFINGISLAKSNNEKCSNLMLRGKILQTIRPKPSQLLKEQFKNSLDEISPNQEDYDEIMKILEDSQFLKEYNDKIDKKDEPLAKKGIIDSPIELVKIVTNTNSLTLKGDLEIFPYSTMNVH